MEEIKFRAWLKNEHKMVDVKEISWIFNNITYYNGSTGMEAMFDEIELMQYTGLKDKNGAEIYEGDIVVPYYVTPMGEITEELDYDNKGMVKIKNGCVRVQKGKTWYQLNIRCEEEKIDYISNYGELFDYKNDTALVKVIGNIYDNPELLEEQC